MNRIATGLRQHWPFFLFVPLLIIVLTWPIAINTVDTNAMWMPSENLDQGLKLWDAWYGGRMLAGTEQFYFTELLFFPNGMSLVFHNFSMPHVFLQLLAQQFLPATNAYSLSFLLVIFANAAASYVYIFYLFRDRWLGMFGSVVFGLSVFVLKHPMHPDLNIVAAIPLVMYCMQRALSEGRHQWMLLAGLLVGFTAFTSMYTLVCLAITAGIFLLFKLPNSWNVREFWTGILLLLVISGSISALRVYPMMRDSGQLDEALGKGGGQEHGSDLLDLFVHPENVVTEFVFASVLREPVPDVRIDGYLGYVSLLLVAIGLAKSAPRRQSLLWIVIFLTFVILKLGSSPIVNGHTFDNILLPKHYLNALFPAAFKAFWVTAYFHIGILLPLAILATLGLRTLRSAFPAKLSRFVVVACLALNLIEIIEPPDAFAFPAQRLDHIAWLRTEDRQEEIRLINLPFGRGPSKRNAFLQVFSGYPYAEGLAARTPSAAYAYIRQNSILAAWRNEMGILCLPFNEGAFRQSLDQLLADGFSHAVFHKDVIRPIRYANYSVMSVEPAYEDQYARVYRLRDLPGACEDSALVGSNALPQLAAMMSPSAMAGDPDTWDGSDPPDEEASLDNDVLGSSAAVAQPLALKLFADGMVLRAPISLANVADDDRLLPDDAIVLIAFYPVHAEKDLIETAASRLARKLKSCGRIEKPGAAVTEYFTRAEVPCALLLSDDQLAVSYENGVSLANVLLNDEGEQLETFLLWNKLPEDAHGVSIQLFDQDGEKVAGNDFTIRHDSLSRHLLDLSPLDPGDYTLKLILYHYETRASVAGIVVNAQSRFERELEIGSVTID